MRGVAPILAAALALLLLAGCGGSDPSGEPGAAPPAPPPATAEPEEAPEPEPAAEAGPAGAVAPAEAERRAAPATGACRAGDYFRMRTPRLAYAGVVRDTVQAFRDPGRQPLARFGSVNENGAPTVLGVLGRVVGADCRARWYRAQLPLKPNGVVGWVPAAAIDVHPVRTRILVELSQRRVTLWDDGRVVLRAPAAIGSAATPTPTGSFYVNQRLRPTDPSGPFGPGAVGISAFSDVLTGWAQGGPVALHGTNRPELIGQAVSNGCIRLRNDVLEQLFARTLPGTPVVVRP